MKKHTLIKTEEKKAREFVEEISRIQNKIDLLNKTAMVVIGVVLVLTVGYAIFSIFVTKNYSVAMPYILLSIWQAMFLDRLSHDRKSGKTNHDLICKDALLIGRLFDQLNEARKLIIDVAKMGGVKIIDEKKGVEDEK